MFYDCSCTLSEQLNLSISRGFNRRKGRENRYIINLKHGIRTWFDIIQSPLCFWAKSCLVVVLSSGSLCVISNYAYILPLDTMYIMTDFVYSITSCSRITSWEFSHWKSGYIDFMVWRPTGNKYKLVAFNSLYVSGTFQICTMTTSFVRIFHFALITL